jgi:hypothetical protein
MERPPVCQCRVTPEIVFGVDDYARHHLEAGRTYLDGWAAEYVCRATGIRWLLDHPRGELQGGGPARLRTAASVAAALNNDLRLVEFLFPEDERAREVSEDLSVQLATKYETAKH